MASLGDDARDQRAGGGRERAHELVPGEQARSGAGRRHQLAERRLLDRQERPDLVAAGADDADGRGDREHREDGRGHEHQARHEHQAGAREQHPPRPMRSAWVVSHSEMAASPSSVSVSSSPMSPPE